MEKWLKEKIKKVSIKLLIKTQTVINLRNNSKLVI